MRNLEGINSIPDFESIYRNPKNEYFLSSRVSSIQQKGNRLACNIVYQRYEYKKHLSFGYINSSFCERKALEFPSVYPKNLTYQAKIEIFDENVIRLQFAFADEVKFPKTEMVVKDRSNFTDFSLKKSGGQTSVITESLKIKIIYNPFSIIFYDKKGKVLFNTVHMKSYPELNNKHYIPIGFVRQSDNLERDANFSFSLRPNEHIYGCGENFQSLDKRGQTIYIWTMDAHGCQTDRMYKPIPFFMSSRGYGMFVNSSYPMRFLFGSEYQSTGSIQIFDKKIDLFVFVGDFKEILKSYTIITGKPTMPPLWSFGLWMSRITYLSQKEVEKVVQKLRQYKVPCDVIHIDTGWFEKDWMCDYKFSKSRFPNPKKMLTDFKKAGFHLSLWQLPYVFKAVNGFKEGLEKGYFAKSLDGYLPTEDGVIDFSNPATVKWYKNKLRNLFNMGVAVIKADFGEAAPIEALYYRYSGKEMHNLYPLLYNRTVSEVTREVTGDNIIWARSAYAGSQRYPVHWGGDAASDYESMFTSLRAGLSFGLSGFPFWSHDMGGFTKPPTKELYARWLQFGFFTSHSRCHGFPPREPWEFGDELLQIFIKYDMLKYRLMPYIFSQAKKCCEESLPMLRPLFLEFPNDPTTYFIEDQYLFGESFLVAPLFSERNERKVYLPPSRWCDYWSSKVYIGPSWITVNVPLDTLPLFIREGSIIPMAPEMQYTTEKSWNPIRLDIFPGNKESFSFALFHNKWGLKTIKAEVKEKMVKLSLPDCPVDWQIEIRNGGSLLVKKSDGERTVSVGKMRAWED